MGQTNRSTQRRRGPRAAALLSAIVLLAGCAGAPLSDVYPQGTVPAYTAPAENLCTREAPAARRVVLSCAVTDHEDAAVEGAVVDLWLDRPPFDLATVGRRSTDGRGTCVFKVPEGEAVIRVRHPDHPAVCLRVAVFGPGTQPLSVRLPEGVAVRGTVRGPSGEPLAGAQVRLLSDASRRFLRDAVPVPILSYLVGQRHPLYDYGLVRSGAAALEDAVTASDGGFSFRVAAERLAADAQALQRPTLHVSADGFLPRLVRMERAPDEGVEVDLAPLERVLVGTVFDGGGAPLEGAMVFAALPDPVKDPGALLFTTTDSSGGEQGISRPWFAGPTGKTGLFRLPLPSGVEALKYLAVVRPGYTSRIFYGFRQPDPAEEEGGFEVYLNPGTKVEVRVAGEAGRPEECDARAGCTERENFLDGWFDGTAAVPTAGGFSVEGAGTRAFYLRVEALGYAPQIRMVRRAERVPVEVRLRPGKTLRGQVVDRVTGKGVEGAEVRVALGTMTVMVGVEDFTLRRAVRTGPEGFFAAEDLPGDFHAGKVYVFLDGALKWRADLPADFEPLLVAIHSSLPQPPPEDDVP